MTTTTVNGMTVLTADEGMILVSDGIYSDKVYLGIYDHPANWVEAPIEEEAELPQSEDIVDQIII